MYICMYSKLMSTFLFSSFNQNRMQFNNLSERYIYQKLLISITLQIQSIIFSVTLIHKKRKKKNQLLQYTFQPHCSASKKNENFKDTNFPVYIQEHKVYSHKAWCNPFALKRPMIKEFIWQIINFVPFNKQPCQK